MSAIEATGMRYLDLKRLPEMTADELTAALKEHFENGSRRRKPDQSVLLAPVDFDDVPRSGAAERAGRALAFEGRVEGERRC